MDPDRPQAVREPHTGEQPVASPAHAGASPPHALLPMAPIGFAGGGAAQIIALQRAAGNAAVAALVSGRTAAPVRPILARDPRSTTSSIDEPWARSLSDAELRSELDALDRLLFDESAPQVPAEEGLGDELQHNRRILLAELRRRRTGTGPRSTEERMLLAGGPDAIGDVDDGGGTISIGEHGSTVASVRLRVHGSPPQRPFAWEYEPPVHGARYGVLRVVAAPGVDIQAIGFGEGEPPFLEVIRVQDPRRVPPQGAPIHPGEFLGQMLLPGASADPFPLQTAAFESFVTIDGMRIRRRRPHQRTGAFEGVVIGINNLSGDDRFAYELWENAGLPTVSVVVTPRVDVEVLTRTSDDGELDWSWDIRMVEQASEVPAPEEPCRGVGRRHPVRAISPDEQAFVAAAGFIPVAGDVMALFEAAYVLATGRDLTTGQRLSDGERMTIYVAALIGVIPLAGEALRASTGALRSLDPDVVRAVSDLGPADRAEMRAAAAQLEAGEELSEAVQGDLARIFDELDTGLRASAAHTPPLPRLGAAAFPPELAEELPRSQLRCQRVTDFDRTYLGGESPPTGHMVRVRNEVQARRFYAEFIRRDPSREVEVIRDVATDRLYVAQGHADSGLPTPYMAAVVDARRQDLQSLRHFHPGYADAGRRGDDLVQFPSLADLQIFLGASRRQGRPVTSTIEYTLPPEEAGGARRWGTTEVVVNAADPEAPIRLWVRRGPNRGLRARLQRPEDVELIHAVIRDGGARDLGDELLGSGRTALPPRPPQEGTVYSRRRGLAAGGEASGTGREASGDGTAPDAARDAQSLDPEDRPTVPGIRHHRATDPDIRPDERPTVPGIRRDRPADPDIRPDERPTDAESEEAGG